MNKYLVLLCAILLLSALIMSSCTLQDPNIQVDTEANSTNEKTEETNKPIPDYLNIDDFAIRSYELSALLSQPNFNSPEEMSVSALVQYCFCHLYYDRLIDMPTKGVNERHCTIEELQNEVVKQFGSVDLDLTQADLYNVAHKQFEMWEPLYGTSVFYNTDATAMADNQYRIVTTFYEDDVKDIPLFRTQMMVKDNNGSIIILSLKTVELGSTESTDN